MAGADYKRCDVCGGKAFYDADLSYETGENIDGEWREVRPSCREAGVDQGSYGYALGYVGDWAVICTDCSQTHKTIIVPIDFNEHNCDKLCTST